MNRCPSSRGAILRRAVVAALVMTVSVSIVPNGTGADTAPRSPVTPASSSRVQQSKLLPSTPTTPTKDQITKLTTLASMSSLRSSLQTEFPDTFGGLYSTDGRSHFQISIVPAPNSGASASNVREQIEAAVDKFLAKASPNDKAAAPISYGTATRSLSSLFNLRDQVVRDPASLGLNAVESAGIDDRSNTVAVVVPSAPQSRAAFAISSMPVNPALSITTEAPAAPYDRIADSPPWYGGDQLKTAPVAGYNTVVCSAGFAAHDSNRKTYLLTAGHCTSGNANSSWVFYNTTATGSSYSASRKVGSPDKNAWFQGWDFERIPTPSLGYFFHGNATVYQVANDAPPVVGNTVCNDGVMTRGACGTVQWTDSVAPTGIAGTSSNGIFQSSAPGQPGDSGGPVVWPTIYGYIAQGLVSGGAPGGGPYIWATGINYAEFLLGVRVTSIVNP
jgi:hypothetical protein